MAEKANGIEKSTIFSQNQWTVMATMTSLNRSRPWSLIINSIKFGDNPTSILAGNANVIQKSTIFSQNQWTVKTTMTSSWRHWIGLVLDHLSSILSSLGTIRLKLWPQMRTVCRKNNVFSQNQWTVKTMMTSSWRHWIGLVLSHCLSIISSLGMIRPKL